MCCNVCNVFHPGWRVCLVLWGPRVLPSDAGKLIDKEDHNDDDDDNVNVEEIITLEERWNLELIRPQRACLIVQVMPKLAPKLMNVNSGFCLAKCQRQLEK